MTIVSTWKCVADSDTMVIAGIDPGGERGDQSVIALVHRRSQAVVWRLDLPGRDEPAARLSCLGHLRAAAAHIATLKTCEQLKHHLREAGLLEE